MRFTYGVVRLNEGVVDGNDVDVIVLDAVREACQLSDSFPDSFFPVRDGTER